MENSMLKWYSGPFTERLKKDLLKLCTEKRFLNGELYDIEELNECWHKSAPQYMADAVPEIPHYPSVAIAWAAFFGLGAACLWDTVWDTVKEEPDLYVYIRNARGFDCLDDCVMEDLLKPNTKYAKALTNLIQDCAEIALTLIRKECINPQSVEAFQMYAKTTELFFKLGVSIELFALGYKYEKVNLNLN